MSFELKAKEENYKKVVTKLQGYAGIPEKEQRAYTSEEKEVVKTLQAEERSLREEIESLKLSAGINSLASVEQEVRSEQPLSHRRLPSKQDQRLALRGWLATEAGWHDLVTDEHRAAAARCQRNLSMSRYEVRQQSVGTDTEGGHLAPAEELSRIVHVLEAFGGMREAATVIPRSTGTQLKYPKIDDTANVAAARAELGAFTDTPITVGEVLINTASFQSGVFPVSREVLRDADFPLEQIINTKLAERLARKVNAVATTDATFQGITNGLTPNAYEFALGQVTYPNLVNMKKVINRAYGNRKWMVNSNFLAEIQLMVDDNGFPLWRPDLVGGVPGSILGDPYIINDDLDDDTVLYGKLDEYHMLEVGSPELVVLRERYRVENNAVAFMIVGYYGGKVVDTNAMALFNRAAA